jgi:DUF438 domain-containing protein
MKTIYLHSGKKITDETVNIHHPLLAVQAVHKLIDEFLQGDEETLTIYSNQTDVVTFVYYYQINHENIKQYNVVVYFNNNIINEEYPLGDLFGEWNKSFDFLDKTCCLKNKI